MRTLWSIASLIVDSLFEVANNLDRRFNRARREAEEQAEYEEFVRNWTDGTDHG